MKGNNAVKLPFSPSAVRLSSALSPEESARLAELEPIIQRGLTNFVEVGNALSEISDKRLYRSTHSTFKEYVEDKWCMTASHAYRLCESAEVIKNLPTECHQLVTTESQARELAKVEPEKRVEMVQAVAHVGKMTAKAIKAEVRKQIKPAKVNEASSENDADAAKPIAPRCETQPSLNRWYSKAKPERRGEHLKTIISCRKPVRVPNREVFIQQVHIWIEQSVEETTA
jgi:hypothetical protein